MVLYGDENNENNLEHIRGINPCSMGTLPAVRRRESTAIHRGGVIMQTIIDMSVKEFLFYTLIGVISFVISYVVVSAVL